MIDTEVTLLVEYMEWFRENISQDDMDALSDEDIIQRFLEER